jgi:hypothetical protein
LNLLNVQNRIKELMARFIAQVECSAAMSHTDINRVSETVLIPLFKEIYGFKSLKNLNSSEGSNYPGIDLADEDARVAFQVTSTPDSDKINHTLELFTQNRLYEKYDRIIVYILTRKQKSYSGRGFEQRIDGKFNFDKEKDIQDAGDLLAEISAFQLVKARKIEQILENNFGDGQPSFLEPEDEIETEAVFLNLLEMSFPDTLYVADVAIEGSQLWNAVEHSKRGKRFISTRDLVRTAMKDKGLIFAADWVTHANQIITFHDLRDETLPLHQIIEPETITPITPEEFYGQDENYERVFKDLLRRCLQQKLYHQQVQWQNEENMFIFTDIDGQPIRKEYWEQTSDGRTVYQKVMKKNKPDEVMHHKHFAFRVHFYSFNGKWYVGITPDWFFSYDGYHCSFYSASNLSYLKKKEKNRQVGTHTRFVAYFLTHDKPSDLFDERTVYPYLTFGTLPALPNAPFLDDKDWLAGENKEERLLMQELDL